MSFRELLKSFPKAIADHASRRMSELSIAAKSHTSRESPERGSGLVRGKRACGSVGETRFGDVPPEIDGNSKLD